MYNSRVYMYVHVNVTPYITMIHVLNVTIKPQDEYMLVHVCMYDDDDTYTSKCYELLASGRVRT